MLTRRLTMIAVAAAFAASSSVALLQSAQRAFAETDHNTRVAQNQRHDRDWNQKHRKHTNPNGFWSNGRWHANNGNHNGQHKRHPDRDRH